MKNLLVVADTYPPKKDGVVTYLRYVLPLLKEDYRITLAAPRFSEEAPPLCDGIDLILTPCVPVEVANYYPAIPTLELARAIRKADLVFVHDLAPLGSTAIGLARLLSKPAALFCHHDESVMLAEAFKIRNRRPLARPRFRRLVDRIVLKYYGYADLIFVATARFYGKLKRLQIPDEKIVFAPFAIDTERFAPDNGRGWREKFNMPSEAKVVLYLGRMSHEKNVETIISSIPQVSSEVPDACYVFAGGGARLDEYRDLAREIAPDANVVFTNWVEWEETPHIYSMADVFPFPSLHETQSFTAMEAMASSLAVIVPKDESPGYSYYEDGVNCLFLDSVKDPRELADKIILLLKNDGLRRKLGENARKKMKGYTWEKHLEKLKSGFECVRRIGHE